MFGEDALEKVILENRHLPAAGIQEAILAAVGAHTAEVPQSDDITLVVIRRRD
ncbi:SpoIIE family protein phosphatase, partial [bacterium]|nr:SpoIIE family protein phosphatase [bacterium]